MARLALSRRGLDEAWRAATLRARRLGLPLALALLGVDDCGALDDAFGHLAGDGALQHLARLLQAKLRPGDAVARFDGEALVLLLPDSTARQGLQVVRRLQREIASEACRFEGRQAFLTFSAGVTELAGEDDLEAAAARAGEAMRRARRAGASRVEVR